ncbi:hypothetical protein FIV07_27320 [Mycobacterium sp. THAF192]|nr:hypothetical protein FIV07_27320 [Mycobacterium sp. THAF192]
MCGRVRTVPHVAPRAACHAICHDAGVVLGNVRQQRATCRITDRVEPLTVNPGRREVIVDRDEVTHGQADGLQAQVPGRREVIVDRDEVTHGQADGLQAQVPGVDRTACGDDDFVSSDMGIRGGDADTTGIISRDRSHRVSELDLDTAVLQRACHTRTDEGFGTLQQCGPTRQQGDVTSEPGQDRRTLHADDSAPENDAPGGDAGHGRKISIGPRCRIPQLVEVGDERACSGSEDDGALGVEPTLRSIGFHDRHRALPVEAAPAMDDLDAGPPQIGDDVAIDEVIDDHVSLVEDRLDVHALARYDLSHSRNRFGELEDLDGADQRLGRIARPVVAFPADQPVFDEGDGEALGCEANCRGRAAGAAAYHHRVGSVGSALEFSSTVVTSAKVSAHLTDLK